MADDAIQTDAAQSDKPAAVTGSKDRVETNLAGQDAWLICDGRAGNVSHLRGVAQALSLKAREIVIAPSGVHKHLAPWGPVAAKERLGQPGSLLAPPWPKLAVATGRASIPYIRALKRLAGKATFTLVLQDPRTGEATADLIWVPAHDKRRGANVITTLASPHIHSPDAMAARRNALPPDILALPEPRVLVSLGGPNKVYRYTNNDNDKLAGALRSLATTGVSLMMTASRRSSPDLIAAAKSATEGAPRIFWDGAGKNPYPDFLSAADMLIVTADSVNMCGEACATGKPVFIFHPGGGSPKFDRFHSALETYGATRPLPDDLSQLPNWAYTPLYSAEKIAAEVERRYTAFVTAQPV